MISLCYYFLQVIENSLNLKYKEFEEHLKFCEKVYSQNETCKEIKKRMQILCDGTEKKASHEHITKIAQALLLLKKP